MPLGWRSGGEGLEGAADSPPPTAWSSSPRVCLLWYHTTVQPPGPSGPLTASASSSEKQERHPSCLRRLSAQPWLPGGQSRGASQGGTGRPISHEDLWFRSPWSPPPALAGHLSGCLSARLCNQIIWASGSSQFWQIPLLLRPLQMDETSRLNTNYVHVTPVWVFLARGGVFLSEITKCHFQSAFGVLGDGVPGRLTPQGLSTPPPGNHPGMSQLQPPRASPLLWWVCLPLWALSPIFLTPGQLGPAH